MVYVDGVRTAFGRATADGFFAKTRADDMAVKTVREVLRRNPQLPPERVDDVVFAATAQVGDQGLTLGRDVALLAGLPRPFQASPSIACAPVRSPHDRGCRRDCDGRCGRRSRGWRRAHGPPPDGSGRRLQPAFVAERLIDESAAVMGQTAENLHDDFPQLTQKPRMPMPSSPSDARAGVGRRRHGRDRGADVRLHRRRLDGRRPRRVPPPGHDDGRARDAADAVPCRWPRHRRKLGRPHRRATAALVSSADAAAELGLEPKMRLAGFAYAESSRT